MQIFMFPEIQSEWHVTMKYWTIYQCYPLSLSSAQNMRWCRGRREGGGGGGEGEELRWVFTLLSSGISLVWRSLMWLPWADGRCMNGEALLPVTFWHAFLKQNLYAFESGFSGQVPSWHLNKSARAKVLSIIKSINWSNVHEDMPSF